MMEIPVTPEQDAAAQRLTVALVTGLMHAHHGGGQEALDTALADIAEASLRDDNLTTVLIFKALGDLLARSLTSFATVVGVEPLAYWQQVALCTESLLPPP